MMPTGFTGFSGERVGIGLIFGPPRFPVCSTSNLEKNNISTFSSEVVTLALRQQYGWAPAEISIHVAGSLALTVLGMFIVRFLMAKGDL